MEPPSSQLQRLFSPGHTPSPRFLSLGKYMPSPGHTSAGNHVTFQFPRLSPAGSTPSRRGLFHTNTPPRWEWLRFHPTTIYSGTRSRAPNYFRGRLTNAPPRQASVTSDERAFSCLDRQRPCTLFVCVLTSQHAPPRLRLYIFFRWP